MTREVRKVPANWEHPKQFNEYLGKMVYRPLLGGSFADAVAHWDEGAAQWEDGFRRHWGDGGWIPKDSDMTFPFSEWAGDRPIEENFMPEWPEDERTHFMMYETTSEGTPISPAFSTPEELAQWLVDNDASAFADQAASYAAWLRIARGGFALSAVLAADGGLVSGVQAFKEDAI